MSGFNLDNYKTVPERMAEARTAYPDGRLQSEVIELPAAFADKFVAVRATFYRTADDPTPAVGLAWEPTPGKTPYTKDSELMNAETSAWGRALVAAFAVDTQKGIASREEVEARQPTRRQTSRRATETAPTATESDGVAEYAREAVKGFLSWSDEEKAEAYKRHSRNILEGKPKSVEEVQQVVGAMRHEYDLIFPAEMPL